MAKEKEPITIKKYANRRLYNTATSAYITLKDVAAMVKKGDDFMVFDAKSGDDITRPVLSQIIFEKEGKDGQSLMPINFLRQLIRFYGDSMQMLVPSYLEFTIGKLVSEQAKFRDAVAKNLGGSLTAPIFDSIEEQTRKNMALFEQALQIFNPFGKPLAKSSEKPPDKSAEEPATERGGQYAKSDIEEMKRQLSELQKRIEALASKDSR